MSTSTATSITQDRRSIAIQTPLGKDALLLRSLRGEEGISRLFHFELDLLSKESKVDYGQIIGKAATIGIRLGDGTDRFFNGVISRFVLAGGEGAFTVFRAELVPWTWLLTRTTDCRVFQNLPIPGIIEKVFKDHGFQDYKNRLTATYPPCEYCVQYRETDFNFVSRLMEQCGIFYFFEHENGKHTLVLADNSAEHHVFPGLEKARYRPSKGDHYEADIVTAWSMALELRPTKYSLGEYNFETPNAKLGVNVDSVHAPESPAVFEVYDYPGGYAKRAEGEGLVRVRIEEQEAQLVTIRGASTLRGVAAGCRFDLVDHPHQELNQSYVVAAVAHSASEPSYIPGASDPGTPYKNTFTAIPFTVPYRPLRVTPKPIIHGVQTAIVCGKKGEELWVDKYGRVKVQFHWDREGKRDENSSCWVRVSQNWAGKRWGAMFLPRVGQEVIVEFLEGDPDRPIITGRVYNGDQTPPYDLPGGQTKSTLKSSSSKGGAGFNEWRFDDKKGAEQVFIHGQRDLDFVIEHQSRELIGEEQHLIVTASRVEEVGGEQHLKTGGDRIEEIGGDGYMSVAKGLYLKAGTSLVLETAGDITLKAAGGFITVGAGGVNIQGSIVNINSGGAPGASATKAVRPPNKAASALPGGASDGGDGEDTGEPPVDLDIVQLYRDTYDKNAAKLSEEDKKAYEAALKELADARDRGDVAGMQAAKDKLDAILQKNNIPIPEGADAALAAAVANAKPQEPGATSDRPEKGKLHVEGTKFVRADGSLFAWRGATMFMLFARHLRGESITPQINWMVRLGVNVARVFGCVPWGGEWEFYARPWERPDFDAQFNAFYALLAKAGIRLEYVPLTYSNLSMSVQRAYVQRIYDLIGNGGLDLCMVEIGNEPHVNGIDTRAAISGVNRRGVLSSSGDYFVPSASAENGDGFWPADPKPFHHLDYGTVHTERSLDDGKNRYPRNGKEPFEFMGSTRKPWVDDEPFGIGEVEKRGGGARTTNIRAVVSHHAICHLLTPGSTIHSQAGLEGRAPDPASEPMQNRLAEAISRVWRFIPAESQSGQYSRPHLSPDVFPIQWTPDDSDSMVGHAYASLMGNRAFVVVPMPRAGWTLQPVGGWRVVRTLDGFPFVAELAR